jgi:hypothetical protein
MKLEPVIREEPVRDPVRIAGVDALGRDGVAPKVVQVGTERTQEGKSAQSRQLGARRRGIAEDDGEIQSARRGDLRRVGDHAVQPRPELGRFGLGHRPALGRGVEAIPNRRRLFLQSRRDDSSERLACRRPQHAVHGEPFSGLERSDRIRRRVPVDAVRPTDVVPECGQALLQIEDLGALRARLERRGELDARRGLRLRRRTRVPVTRRLCAVCAEDHGLRREGERPEHECDCDWSKSAGRTIRPRLPKLYEVALERPRRRTPSRPAGRFDVDMRLVRLLPLEWVGCEVERVLTAAWLHLSPL